MCVCVCVCVCLCMCVCGGACKAMLIAYLLSKIFDIKTLTRFNARSICPI